jgi:hypothetical protein
MNVSLVTAPNATALLTRARVKIELLLTGTSDDTFLDNLIAEVSETFYSYANRPLYRAVWRETQEAKSNEYRVLLSRYPVAGLDSASFNGGAQTLTVLSGTSGILCANTLSWGGTWSSSPPLWSFDYSAGWLLPGDDISGAISVSSTDNSYNSSALFGCGPLLRAGDVIYASSFASSSNNGYKIVASTPTTSKIIVAETLVTNSSATASLGVRNLPGWIERVAMQLLELRYHARDRDPAMSRLVVGGAEFNFESEKAEKVLRQEIARKLAMSWVI